MIFSFIVLCGAIQAMNLGVSILTKESRERTADFLLVKPVSRAKIVSSKLLAAMLLLIATNIVFYAAAFLIANGVKTEDFSQKLFLLIHMTLFFVQLMFLAIGMASSVFFAKLRSVLPLSLGVVIGLYLIGALLASGEDKEMIRFISPFKYFALKAYLRGLIIWSVCMFLLVVSGMSKYSALLKSRRSVDFLPCCFCILS
ncbi:ABC transporter permease subunit [Paenibacillus sp. FSL K6-2441]|uniref:ABC transporter permease subunit n=1 Tax=Paenibacillus sp. FSL K6-2441 TaxID=2954679 RepID=UPI0030DD33F2